MMMFLHVSVALLSLLSLGQTAPLSSCESLIQPAEIQGPEQLSGKWIRVAVSSNYDVTEWMIKNFQSSFWVNITADNRSNVLTFTEVKNVYGLCLSQTYQAGLVNNTFQAVTNGTQIPETLTGTTSLLKTSCPDCLLTLNQSPSVGTTVKALILTSKRQTVTAAELEELKKQAECLNMYEPFTMDIENGICPDPQSPGADVLDSAALGNLDLLRQKAIMEQIFSKMGNMDDIIKKFTEAKPK